MAHRTEDDNSLVRQGTRVPKIAINRAETSECMVYDGSIVHPSRGMLQVNHTNNGLRPTHQRKEKPRHLNIYGSRDLERFKIWIYPRSSSFDVRKYQQDIAQTAIFRNTLVCLPTGLGKTLIAAVVMYNYYSWYPSGQVIFMAPTRPLVSQQVKACYDIMGIPEIDTGHLEGSVSVEDREHLWKCKRVIFCTPQTMENDLDRRIVNPSRLSCLVIDEAHRATGNYSYVNVLRYLWDINRNFRILALSATPGADFKRIQSLVQTLKIAAIEIRTEDDPDIAPYCHDKQIEVISCKAGLEAGLDTLRQHLNCFMEPIVATLHGNGLLPCSKPKELNLLAINETIEYRSNVLRRQGLAVKQIDEDIEIADLKLLQTLLHCRRAVNENQLDKAYQAIFDTNRNRFMSEIQSFLSCSMAAANSLNRFKNYLQRSIDDVSYLEKRYPKIIHLRRVVSEHIYRHGQGQSSTRIIIFAELRATVHDIVEDLKSLNWNQKEQLFRPHIFIGQSKSATKSQDESKGIGLNQKSQQQVLQKFHDGEVNILVATSIAEEGLDIAQVDLIVLFEAIASPGRLMQRMGRTGRRRVGRVVMLLVEGKEERKIESVSESLQHIVQILRNPVKRSQLRLCEEESPRMIPDHLPDPVVEYRNMNVRQFDGSLVQGSKWHSNDSNHSQDYIAFRQTQQRVAIQVQEADDRLDRRPLRPDTIERSQDTNRNQLVTYKEHPSASFITYETQREVYDVDVCTQVDDIRHEISDTRFIVSEGTSADKTGNDSEGLMDPNEQSLIHIDEPNKIPAIEIPLNQNPTQSNHDPMESSIDINMQGLDAVDDPAVLPDSQTIYDDFLMDRECNANVADSSIGCRQSVVALASLIEFLRASNFLANGTDETVTISSLDGNRYPKNDLIDTQDGQRHWDIIHELLANDNHQFKSLLSPRDLPRPSTAMNDSSIDSSRDMSSSISQHGNPITSHPIDQTIEAIPHQSSSSFLSDANKPPNNSSSQVSVDVSSNSVSFSSNKDNRNQRKRARNFILIDSSSDSDSNSDEDADSLILRRRIQPQQGNELAKIAMIACNLSPEVSKGSSSSHVNAGEVGNVSWQPDSSRCGRYPQVSERLNQSGADSEHDVEMVRANPCSKQNRLESNETNKPINICLKDGILSKDAAPKNTNEEESKIIYLTQTPETRDIIEKDHQLVSSGISSVPRSQNSLNSEITSHTSSSGLPCCVCLQEGDFSDDDRIMICSGDCGQAVHRSCYGVSSAPVQPFQCDACVYNASRPRHAIFSSTCCLCRKSDGLMRQIAKPKQRCLKPIYGQIGSNDLAHLACVLFCPELTTGEDMRPDNIESLDPDRINLFCDKCRGKGGAVIQCHYRSCYVACHPYCAMISGRWSLAIRESSSQSDCTRYEMYCAKHSKILEAEVFDEANKDLNLSSWLWTEQQERIESSRKRSSHPLDSRVKYRDDSDDLGDRKENSSNGQDAVLIDELSPRHIPCKRLRRAGGQPVVVEKIQRKKSSARDGSKQFFDEEAVLSDDGKTNKKYSDKNSSNDDSLDDEEDDGDVLSGDFINDSFYTQASDISPGISLYLSVDRRRMEEDSPFKIDEKTPRVKFRGAERGLPLTEALLRRQRERQRTMRRDYDPSKENQRNRSDRKGNRKNEESMLHDDMIIEDFTQVDRSQFHLRESEESTGMRADDTLAILRSKELQYGLHLQDIENDYSESSESDYDL